MTPQLRVLAKLDPNGMPLLPRGLMPGYADLEMVFCSGVARLFEDTRRLRLIKSPAFQIGWRLVLFPYRTCLRTKRSEAEYVLDGKLLCRTDAIERRLCHAVYRCLIADGNQIISSADVSDV